MKIPKYPCPYCACKIKPEQKTCGSHRDLLALDLELTGWTPSRRKC